MRVVAAVEEDRSGRAPRSARGVPASGPTRRRGSTASASSRRAARAPRRGPRPRRSRPGARRAAASRARSAAPGVVRRKRVPESRVRASGSIRVSAAISCRRAPDARRASRNTRSRLRLAARDQGRPARPEDAGLLARRWPRPWGPDPRCGRGRSRSRPRPRPERRWSRRGGRPGRPRGREPEPAPRKRQKRRRGHGLEVRHAARRARDPRRRRPRASMASSSPARDVAPGRCGSARSPIEVGRRVEARRHARRPRAIDARSPPSSPCRWCRRRGRTRTARSGRPRRSQTASIAASPSFMPRTSRDSSRERAGKRVVVVFVTSVAPAFQEQRAGSARASPSSRSGRR